MLALCYFLRLWRVRGDFDYSADTNRHVAQLNLLLTGTPSMVRHCQKTFVDVARFWLGRRASQFHGLNYEYSEESGCEVTKTYRQLPEGVGSGPL